jgi:hypothetical protein
MNISITLTIYSQLTDHQNSRVIDCFNDPNQIITKILIFRSNAQNCNDSRKYFAKTTRPRLKFDSNLI